MPKILIHPAYFPSIAQMTAVAQADEVVFEVMDNYQKQTYRNRAYIAHSNGQLLLNVPIKHTKKGIRKTTKNVNTENDFPWLEQHWKSLQSAYRTSPFFEYYEDDLAPIFSREVTSLLEHNLLIYDCLCELIGINDVYTKTTEYIANPDLIDLRHLINAKDKLDFKIEKYVQVHEANHPFLPNLSVLDLLFNQGPNTLNYLESQKFNFQNL